MTNKQTASPEQQAKRSQAVEDYIKLQQHVSPELLQQLEEHVTPAAGQPVLALTMLAIQFGRKLAFDEINEAITLKAMKRQQQEELRTKNQPSALVKSLIDGVVPPKPVNPKAIVVVPGYATPNRIYPKG